MHFKLTNGWNYFFFMLESIKSMFNHNILSNIPRFVVQYVLFTPRATALVIKFLYICTPTSSRYIRRSTTVEHWLSPLLCSLFNKDWVFRGTHVSPARALSDNWQREITSKYWCQSYGSCAWLLTNLSSIHIWSFISIASSESEVLAK